MAMPHFVVAVGWIAIGFSIWLWGGWVYVKILVKIVKAQGLFF